MPKSPIVIPVGRMALLGTTAALAHQPIADEQAEGAEDEWDMTFVKIDSEDESDLEDQSDSEDSWDVCNILQINKPDSALLENGNNICKRFSCTRCDRIQIVDNHVDIDSMWMCGSKGKQQVKCLCGGTKVGHCPHDLYDDICWKPYICPGHMIFDAHSTSTFGGGLKSLSFQLGDPELQARFEGQCSECGLHGKFNEVAQRCQTQACIGIMVIQIDHMPLERTRIGKSAMKQRQLDALENLKVGKRCGDH